MHGFLHLPTDAFEIAGQEAAHRGLFGLAEWMDDAQRRALLDEILRTTSRRHDREIATVLAGKDGDQVVRTDPVTAALVAHLGLRPAVLCLYAWLHEGGFSAAPDERVSDQVIGRRRPKESADTPYVSLHEARQARGMDNAVESLRFGPDAVWIPHGPPYGEIQLPPLPQTVVSALAGRPLKDVLRHPALDRLKLTIAEASLRPKPFGPGEWTILRITTETLGIAPLVSIRPRPRQSTGGRENA